MQRAARRSPLVGSGFLTATQMLPSVPESQMKRGLLCGVPNQTAFSSNEDPFGCCSNIGGSDVWALFMHLDLSPCEAARRCGGGASQSPDVCLHSCLLVAASAWVFPGHSRFLPQSEHMNIRLIGSSNWLGGTRLRGLSVRSPTVTPFDD